jgi:hypothetical protein
MHATSPVEHSDRVPCETKPPLVSELAPTLAHTASGLGGYFDVTVLGGQDFVLVAVTDNGSDKQPATSEPDPDAETGRGLRLVELVARRWGHCGDHATHLRGPPAPRRSSRAKPGRDRAAYASRRSLWAAA